MAALARGAHVWCGCLVGDACRRLEVLFSGDTAVHPSSPRDSPSLTRWSLVLLDYHGRVGEPPFGARPTSTYLGNAAAVLETMGGIACLQREGGGGGVSHLARRSGFRPLHLRERLLLDTVAPRYKKLRGIAAVTKMAVQGWTLKVTEPLNGP